MPQRTIEAILAEWRAAEARLGDALTDRDLANASFPYRGPRMTDIGPPAVSA